MYSTAFSSDGVTIQQITEWNMFVSCFIISCYVLISLPGSLAVTLPLSRFAIRLVQIPVAIAGTSLTAWVPYITCPTMLRMASSKCATRMPWDSLEFIPRTVKRPCIPSLPNLLVRSPQFPTRLSSLLAPTVKPTRVAIYTLPPFLESRL